MNIETLCNDIYQDLKKDNIYKKLISDSNQTVVIMKYEFMCEINFKKDDYQLVPVYSTILVKNIKYFKYDIITEDSINFLNDNCNFNKYYNLDNNYKLHCYVKNKIDKKLDMYLPIFIVSIEYKRNKYCNLI